jgi:protein-S-isoprenylcysteine O-methyltransferase Ste14
VLFGAGFGLVTWSVAVNRFFSSVVRVQADRGHSIVTSGPYTYVRHPGYLGMLMSYPFVSLAIGSWWALIPGALCFAIVLRRAMLEDAYLQRHLPGYREYAGSVAHRLIPGVW